MASEISELAVRYIAQNAASYVGQPEEQAVSLLAEECRRYLDGEGWSASDYNVDLHQIARKELISRRND
ncbi:MAG: hypothetical protein AAFU49_02825 [Pseudomonadota bacterium]